MKLANEMWGDRFQVVVTTHLDKDHIEERSVHIQDTLDMITANEERAAGREVPQQTTYEETNITTKKKERNYER